VFDNIESRAVFTLAFIFLKKVYKDKEKSMETKILYITPLLTGIFPRKYSFSFQGPGF